MRLTALAAVALIAASTGFADAQSRQPQTGVPEGGVPEGMDVVSTLWCDTPDQLETLLKAYYVNKVPLSQAMAEINRFDPDACVRARVIVKPGEEVRRFIAGDALIAVSSAQVHGVMRGPYAVMMRMQTWYSATVVAELTPI